MPPRKNIKSKPHDPLSRIVEALAMIAMMPIREKDGLVLCGSLKTLSATAKHFGDDAVAIEAFMNHIHIADVVYRAAPKVNLGRGALVKIGELLMHSWALRLISVLKGRRILFFLGGAKPEDVSLRFHIKRAPRTEWAPISGSKRLRDTRIFELSERGLRETVSK